MIDLKLNEDVDSIFSIEDHYEAIERYMLLENELTELDCELSKKETALNNLLLFKECVDAIGWTPSIEFLIGNQITENDLDDACENLSSSLFKTKLKLSSMFAKVTDTGTSVLKSYLLKFQKIDSSELSSIPDKIRKALAAGESDERDGFRIVSLAGYGDIDPNIEERLNKPWNIKSAYDVMNFILMNDIVPRSMTNDTSIRDNTEFDYKRAINDIALKVNIDDYDNMGFRKLKQKVDEAIKYLPKLIAAASSIRKTQIGLKQNQQQKQQVVDEYRKARDNKSFGTIQNAAEQQKKAAIANKERKQIARYRFILTLQRFCIHKAINSCKRLDRALIKLNLKPTF